MQKWKEKMLPMPTENVDFQITRALTGEEMFVLSQGHSPLEMEDKGFSFFKEGKLYIGRSWTGYCIYIVSFDNATNIHNVTVNRNPNQYRNTSTERDIEIVDCLLKRWSHS